jgi:hypothetical protein
MSALCLTSTLRQDASGRNSKTRRGCAETVEAGTFLWKGMEKPGEISIGESRNEGHYAMPTPSAAILGCGAAISSGVGAVHYLR